METLATYLRNIFVFVLYMNHDLVLIDARRHLYNIVCINGGINYIKESQAENDSSR